MTQQFHEETIASATEHDHVFLMKDGSYRWSDETGDLSRPHTSVASAYVELLDYCFWLEWGFDWLEVM
jgi:hypothetical protein